MAGAPVATAAQNENAIGAIAYITFIPALIFLLIEPYKHSRFVKFHAWQEIFLSIARIIVACVFWILPGLGLMRIGLNVLVGIGFFAIWLIAIINAAQGKMWKIPVIGDMAESQAAKTL